MTDLEYDSVDEAKEALRLTTARAGGNAFVEFWWERHVAQVLAGHGPKGNPYY